MNCQTLRTEQMWRRPERAHIASIAPACAEMLESFKPHHRPGRDGKADQKSIVFQKDDYRMADNNMEHQRSGLDWNLDNNIYITYDPVRASLVRSAKAAHTAGFLAQEAWERFKVDETGFDAAKLVPFYIKTQDVPET